MKICLTGGHGFLGQHVWRQLLAEKHTVHLLPGRAVHDLRTGPIDFGFAECVVHLAYPGSCGIQTSIETPADLVHDQLLLDLNVISQAAEQRVPKIITIGSVCEYPATVTFPTNEEQLWEGYPELVNAPYGIAKRMQQGMLEAYRRQWGLVSTQLILGNMYGPGDRSGHVIPSLIRRALEAKKIGGSLVVWGSGRASREFLYVEDAARAVAQAVALEGGVVSPINIVSSCEISIQRLVELIANEVGFTGTIHWDHTKPDGALRRYFSRKQAKLVLGWLPQVDFATGLRHTVAWLRKEENL